MRKSQPTAYIVLIIILLSVVFLLLLGVLTNKRISAYTLTYLSAKPYEMLDLIVNYFSMGLTILLGVVVYHQSQKINDLESAEYDIFVGVNRLDYSYMFDDTFTKEGMQKADFCVLQTFSKERKGFLALLDVDLPEKKRAVFLPLSFVTKNRLLITSLDFREMNLTIITEDFQKYQQHFSKSREVGAFHDILENDSSFVFGVGMMVPDSFKIDELQLDFTIGIHDQIGRDHISTAQIVLKNISSLYYLKSSKSQIHLS